MNEPPKKEEPVPRLDGGDRPASERVIWLPRDGRAPRVVPGKPRDGTGVKV